MVKLNSVSLAHASAYALKQNFIQNIQLVTDDKKVATLAGHQPQSTVQYTKYGNSEDGRTKSSK